MNNNLILYSFLSFVFIPRCLIFILQNTFFVSPSKHFFSEMPALHPRITVTSGYTTLVAMLTRQNSDLFPTECSLHKCLREKSGTRSRYRDGKSRLICQPHSLWRNVTMSQKCLHHRRKFPQKKKKWEKHDEWPVYLFPPISRGEIRT